MKNKLFLLLGILILAFAAPQVANAIEIQGYVFCDENGDGTLNGEEYGVGGITVNFYINGAFFSSVETDSTGYFSFSNHLGDDWLRVEVDRFDADLPDNEGMTTPEFFDFFECGNYQVYFGFDCECCPPCEEYPVKTQGYWKHNTCYWADPPERENQGYQEEPLDLENALERINDRGWYEIFGDPLTIESACEVFQDAKGNNPCAKAKAQLLAVMLNVEREYVPEDASLSNGMTVLEAIEQCIEWIDSGFCKDAQDLAESINSGTAFGETIPDSGPANSEGPMASYSSGSKLGR